VIGYERSREIRWIRCHGFWALEHPTKLSVVCQSETGKSERPVATVERRMALVVFPPRLGWKSRPGNSIRPLGSALLSGQLSLQRTSRRKRLC
jgi:hypothetical protein